MIREAEHYERMAKQAADMALGMRRKALEMTPVGTKFVMLLNPMMRFSKVGPEQYAESDGTEIVHSWVLDQWHIGGLLYRVPQPLT